MSVSTVGTVDLPGRDPCHTEQDAFLQLRQFSPRCTQQTLPKLAGTAGSHCLWKVRNSTTIVPCTISRREAGHPVPAPQGVKAAFLPHSRSPRYILDTGKSGELESFSGSPTAGGPRVRCRKGRQEPMGRPGDRGGPLAPSSFSLPARGC